MAYALKFVMNSKVLNPSLLGIFYTCTFQIIDFDIRVELNMFFIFVVVIMAE
jgi:hypothetical protein